MAEAALDTIALSVGCGVVRDDHLAGSVGWDDGCCAHPGDEHAQGVAVIGFVGEHGFAGLATKQGRCLSHVAGLSGRDNEPERAPERISQHVDLGGQSTSGAPQRLIPGPPFPLAACW